MAKPKKAAKRTTVGKGSSGKGSGAKKSTSEGRAGSGGRRRRGQDDDVLSRGPQAPRRSSPHDRRPPPGAPPGAPPGGGNLPPRGLRAGQEDRLARRSGYAAAIEPPVLRQLLRTRPRRSDRQYAAGRRGRCRLSGAQSVLRAPGRLRSPVRPRLDRKHAQRHSQHPVPDRQERGAPGAALLLGGRTEPRARRDPLQEEDPTTQRREVTSSGPQLPALWAPRKPPKSTPRWAWAAGSGNGVPTRIAGLTTWGKNVTRVTFGGALPDEPRFESGDALYTARGYATGPAARDGGVGGGLHLPPGGLF